MKDTFGRIKELGGKDTQALREEYNEWIDASEGGNKHPHVLYMNQMEPKVKKTIIKGLKLPLDNCLTIRIY